jgi:hypothetical protein
MIGDSAEGFPMGLDLDGEGRIHLLSPWRHGMGAQPTLAMTVLRPENPPAAHATATTPLWQATPLLDTDLPHERWFAGQEDTQ